MKLARWMARRAAREARRPPLEGALLAGRFATYARYRLSGFAATRVVGIAVHLVEILLLYGVLPHGVLVRTVVAINACALGGGFWWGALEVLRARLRAQPAGPARVAEIGAWLGRACLAAAAIVAGAGLWLAIAGAGVAEVYVAIVLARLAGDLVVRTLYSGVAAVLRVYRPLLSLVAADLAGLGAGALLVRAVGPWGLPVTLLVGWAISRGLAVHYTLRVYRGLRLGPVALRWSGAPGSLRAVLAAGFAAAAGRASSLLVLFFAAWGDPSSTLLVHMLAPALATAHGWPQVFYLDLTRLAQAPAAALRRRFDRRLVWLALWVAPVIWALALGTSGWAGLLPRPAAALALLPVVVAQSLLATLQLTHFVRGRFALTLGSAAVVMAGLAIAPSWEPVVTWLAMSAGVAFLVLFARRPPARAAGLCASFAEWRAQLPASARARTAILEDARRDHVLRLAAFVVDALGPTGAVVTRGRRVHWFERGPRTLAAAELVRAGGGLLGRLVDGIDAPPPPRPTSCGTALRVADGTSDIPPADLAAAWRDALAVATGHRAPRDGKWAVGVETDDDGTIVALRLAPRK